MTDMTNLQTKHFGDKIRTCHLNSDRFPEIQQLQNKDVLFPKFGILTRYEDGTVGVSIHYMGQPEENNIKFGYWTQEATQETTIHSWAETHDINPSFSSVEDIMK